MKRAVYVCSLWCEADCPHGHPCEIFARSPHPQRRGHPLHFAYDSATGLGHEWAGKAGRCEVFTLPDDGPGDG